VTMSAVFEWLALSQSVYWWGIGLELGTKVVFPHASLRDS
jgi:hypothetical protein